MGLVRFAYKMLLRKRKESLAYGLMLFFLVITTVILSDVVNNPSIRHGEAYMGDFLITFIIFIVICFSSVMLYFANDAFLQLKSEELLIMGMSGQSFLAITSYLWLQIMMLLIAFLPLGLCTGYFMAVGINKMMFILMHIHASPFFQPLHCFFYTGLFFLVLIPVILLIDAGFVYRHNIADLLHEDHIRNDSNVVMLHLPSSAYIIIALLAIVMFLTVPVDIDHYAMPCMVGAIGSAGMLVKTIPHFLKKQTSLHLIDNKIALISMSFLSEVLKKAKHIITIYCIATIMMIHMIMTLKDDPVESLVAAHAYIITSLLLSVSMMYLYRSMILKRKMAIINLYKVGYMLSQFKKIIKQEVMSFFGLLIALPGLYIIVMLLLLLMNHTISLSFVMIVMVINILPPVIMALMTWRYYRQSIIVELEEGVKDE